MKFILAFLAATAIYPTWHDYAQYNARYTALLLHVVPYQTVKCGEPYKSGNAKCIVTTPKHVAVMLCPTNEYNTCEAWVRELD